jgi:phosphohistidine phosphatase
LSKRVLILRHAKAAPEQAGQDDHDRPLAPRGRRDAPRIGRLVRAQSLVPDLALTSTARRARSTAELMLEACGFRGELRIVPWLYPGDPAETIDYLRTLPAEVRTVLVVGHNPVLEELVHVLTGTSKTMPTAALALVTLRAGEWAAAGPRKALLEELWVPRELPDEG